MMEHLPGPPVINIKLLSHLLFINSPSTITAWDQMKGEGKDIGFQPQNRRISGKEEVKKSSNE